MCENKLKRRMDRAILEGSIREKKVMKRKCVLVAVCVLGVSSMCYAAGRVSSYVHGGHVSNGVTEYSRLDKQEEN